MTHEHPHQHLEAQKNESNPLALSFETKAVAEVNEERKQPQSKRVSRLEAHNGTIDFNQEKDIYGSPEQPFVLSIEGQTFRGKVIAKHEGRQVLLLNINGKEAHASLELTKDRRKHLVIHKSDEIEEYVEGKDGRFSHSTHGPDYVTTSDQYGWSYIDGKEQGTYLFDCHLLSTSPDGKQISVFIDRGSRLEIDRDRLQATVVRKEGDQVLPTKAGSRIWLKAKEKSDQSEEAIGYIERGADGSIVIVIRDSKTTLDKKGHLLDERLEHDPATGRSRLEARDLEARRDHQGHVSVEDRHDHSIIDKTDEKLDVVTGGGVHLGHDGHVSFDHSAHGEHQGSGPGHNYMKVGMADAKAKIIEGLAAAQTRDASKLALLQSLSAGMSNLAQGEASCCHNSTAIAAMLAATQLQETVSILSRLKGALH